MADSVTASTSSPGKPSPQITFLHDGASVQSFLIPLSQSASAPLHQNIVLTLPSLPHYTSTATNPSYIGQTVGRVANRITGARLSNLNGRNYSLARNDGEKGNCLHGGNDGWGVKEWDGPFEIQRQGSSQGLGFTYVSPDGEEGFPGTVRAEVRYTWWEGLGEDRDMVFADGDEVVTLEIEHEVKFAAREAGQEKSIEKSVQETVVAMTNHRYVHAIVPMDLPPSSFGRISPHCAV